MNDEIKEISSGYRNSRRNTSVICGIGIAWAAAQFEFETINLGTFGSVNINGASFPTLIGIICIYSIIRATIEYMMQPDPIRRWNLAQLDYKITLYLVRFSLIVLTASAIGRTWQMVTYLACVFLIAFVGYFVLAALLMFVTMPIRLLIRRRTGRVSVASAAGEAIFYSLLISGVAYVILIGMIGLNIINPFKFLGESFQVISDIQLLIFSGVVLLVLFSFFLEDKFLKTVFAYIPKTIQKIYYENGQKIYSVGPNPEHPEYIKDALNSDIQ